MTNGISPGELREHTPGSEFGFVFREACSRLHEAVEKSLVTPLEDAQEVYFTVGRNGISREPIATFLLAYNHEETTYGQNEALLVSVPIVEEDFIWPVVSTDPGRQYIEIMRPGDESNRVLVNAQNYEELFVESEYPPVIDLMPKLTGYRVISLGEVF